MLLNVKAVSSEIIEVFHNGVKLLAALLLSPVALLGYRQRIGRMRRPAFLMLLQSYDVC